MGQAFAIAAKKRCLVPRLKFDVVKQEIRDGVERPETVNFLKLWKNWGRKSVGKGISKDLRIGCMENENRRVLTTGGFYSVPWEREKPRTQDEKEGVAQCAQKNTGAGLRFRANFFSMLLSHILPLAGTFGSWGPRRRESSKNSERPPICALIWEKGETNLGLEDHRPSTR